MCSESHEWKRVPKIHSIKRFGIPCGRFLMVGTIALAVLYQVDLGLARSSEWGSLKGRFLYNGTPPIPKKVIPTQDVKECGDYDLIEETLMVGKDRGLAHVVITLRPKRGEAIEVHPEYSASEKADVLFDNGEFRFEPHICLMRTTQTLVITNSDPIGHNVYCHLVKNPEFNEIIPFGGSMKKKLTEAETLPIRIDCTIHPWEIAYLVLSDHPYMAASAADGTFEIRNIPAGEHAFGFWHEMSGNMRNLPIVGTKTSRRGEAKLMIPAGGTLDLGDIQVDPKLLLTQ